MVRKCMKTMKKVAEDGMTMLCVIHEMSFCKSITGLSAFV
jgi:ABC-type polar amino acid transport system ATPase subunit